ncbi:MAG: LysM peptidoglycan-binding domain-containing protein [Desulfuromonadales bacterium]|nr:LysM peptidoglycan-binding domain-containing protein [Desulfuromonadales bacterium]NIR34422.1 LysM peptidoglycan-binding domain-containing protein [Desulfuromonadales bacterium]NIS44430.1 LysM peptidoglycan-binding domain-containing protein [Desulfuromonadales bacterium]
MDPPTCEGETTAADEEVTFDFPVVENDKVRYFIDYYTGRARGAFSRWLERSARYLPMMREIFAEEGLPRDLAYLAMVESGFNTRAYSWAHAVGPWQFISSTGRMYDLEQNWWLDERRDFVRATRAAARYLKDLHRQFDGNWYLAVASYNAGPGKLRRAIRRYGSRDFWTLTRGSYLQPETKNYLPKLLAVLIVAKQAEKYGFTDLEPQEPLKYEVVTVPTATDLEIIAKFCDVEYKQVKDLNPELKRWCTPPGVSDYPVRIPAGKKKTFEEKYARLPEAERANYKHHRVQQGDTLGHLARRYGIRVDHIIALNNIRNPRALSIGTDLVLPLKKGFSRRPIKELRDDYIRTRRRSYTVRKGDSLWSISQRFGVTQRQLRVWNRLGWSNIIRPGQRLIVSSKAGGVTRVVKKDGATKKIVYQVKPGDTLWGIGRRFSVGTNQIMAWNDLSENHILRPGDKLTLLVGG